MLQGQQKWSWSYLFPTEFILVTLQLQVSLDISIWLYSMRGSNDILLCNLGADSHNKKDFVRIYQFNMDMFCMPWVGLKRTSMSGIPWSIFITYSSTNAAA